MQDFEFNDFNGQYGDMQAEYHDQRAGQVQAQADPLFDEFFGKEFRMSQLDPWPLFDDCGLNDDYELNGLFPESIPPSQDNDVGVEVPATHMVRPPAAPTNSDSGPSSSDFDTTFVPNQGSFLDFDLRMVEAPSGMSNDVPMVPAHLPPEPSRPAPNFTQTTDSGSTPGGPTPFLPRHPAPVVPTLQASVPYRNDSFVPEAGHSTGSLPSRSVQLPQQPLPYASVNDQCDWTRQTIDMGPSTSQSYTHLNQLNGLGGYLGGWPQLGEAMPSGYSYNHDPPLPASHFDYGSQMQHVQVGAPTYPPLVGHGSHEYPHNTSIPKFASSSQPIQPQDTGMEAPFDVPLDFAVAVGTSTPGGPSGIPRETTLDQSPANTPPVSGVATASESKGSKGKRKARRRKKIDIKPKEAKAKEAKTKKAKTEKAETEKATSSGKRYDKFSNGMKSLPADGPLSNNEEWDKLLREARERGTGPVICPIPNCKVPIERLGFLNGHLRIHHLAYEPDEIGQVKCKVCGSTEVSLKHNCLQRHYKAHVLKNPCPGELNGKPCGFFSSRLDCMAQHVEAIHGVVVYDNRHFTSVFKRWDTPSDEPSS